MKKNIPRISASILTYNQEKYISRAIESLLAQKEYLFEIIVSDDCSTDSTWEIVSSYAQQYPGLFKLNRNEHNLGIFEHIEKTWTLFSGDIVYRLSGDDECGEGWFKKVVEFIEENHIDYKNALFCIYGDYRAIYPNGDSYVHGNKHILSKCGPIKLSIRGLIGNRSACYSIRIQNMFQKVSMGRSYIAEGALDRQLQVFAQNSYYIKHVGDIYYARIGVSTAINGEKRLQHIARWDYLASNLKKWGVKLDCKDLHYISYRKAKEENNTWLKIKHGLLSLDFNLGLKGLQIRRVIFAILCRIPHKKPIRDFSV